MKETRIMLMFMILFANCGFSQTKVTYSYLKSENINHTETIPFFGMEQEFNTVRTFQQDSVFRESRLFTGSEKLFITYKIEKNVWYYKDKNKWKLFYDYKSRLGGRIRVMDITYKISFIKEVNLRGNKIHEIQLNSSVYQSHKLLYYFNPSKGVVLIKAGNGIFLLRSDYFHKELMDKEMDIL